MAALLVTPSDDQLPVSEKTPPSTISLSMRGMVPLSSQPAAAASATSTAVRRALRAPGDLGIFMEGTVRFSVCGRETCGEGIYSLPPRGASPATHCYPPA